MDSDEALARRAAAGDRAAFAALLERHYDRIYRIAARILGNRHDAEDAAQEICAGLARRLASWRGENARGEPAPFAAWLCRVAVNGARDALRRGAARARNEREFSELRALEACGGGAAEERAWLARALDALPEPRRAVALLAVGEGLTHAETAAALGMAEGTVSWHLSEIRAHLRALAKAEEEAGKETAR